MFQLNKKQQKYRQFSDSQRFTDLVPNTKRSRRNLYEFGAKQFTKIGLINNNLSAVLFNFIYIRSYISLKYYLWHSKRNRTQQISTYSVKDLQKNMFGKQKEKGKETKILMSREAH